MGQEKVVEFVLAVEFGGEVTFVRLALTRLLHNGKNTSQKRHV